MASSASAAAVDAWTRRDWRTALQETEGADDTASLALRSWVLSWCVMPEEARVAAEAAAAAATTDAERDVALVSLARAYADADWERALSLVDGLVVRLRGDRHLAWVRGRHALADGRPDDALDHFAACERWAEAEGDVACMVEAWLERSHALLALARNEEATDWAHRAVTASSDPGWEGLYALAAPALERCRALQGVDGRSLGVWTSIRAFCDAHAPPVRRLGVRSNVASVLSLLDRHDEAIELAAATSTACQKEHPSRAAEYRVAEAWIQLHARRAEGLPALAQHLLDDPVASGVTKDFARVLALHGRVAAELDADFRGDLAALASHAIQRRAFPQHLRCCLDLLAARLEEKAHPLEALHASSLALDGPAPEGPAADACCERLRRLRRLLRLTDHTVPVPVGRYLLERRLGAGGMGEVWAADGLAIKWVVLDPKDREAARARFHTEVAAVAARAHEHVVPVYDTGSIGEAASILTGLAKDTPWLAMAQASHSIHDELPDLTWPRARQVLLAVLDGLAAAHAHGLLHLDVKPDNVLVEGGHIWLADFGIAAAAGTSRHTAGTPQYMAPERFRGTSLGPEADLYAVGCMAWQLVTGSVPFDSDLLSLRRMQMTAPLPVFRPRFEVPAGVASWIARMMAKSPDDRPPTAALAAWGLPEGLSTMGEPVEATLPPPMASRLPTQRFDTLPTLELDDEPSEAPRSVAPFAMEAALAPWRQVCAGDVTAAVTGRGLLDVRVPPHIGHEPGKDALWAHLAEVHRSGRAQVVELSVADGDAAIDLAQWLMNAARRSGLVNVSEVARVHGRLPTHLIVLVDGPGQPANVLKLRRLVEAGLPVLGVITWRRGDLVPAYHAALAGLPIEVLEVPITGSGAVAQRLQGMLDLDPRVASALASRVGGDVGWARATLLHWHDQGLLVEGERGFRLRDDLPPEVQPLAPPTQDVSLDGIKDGTLRALELLAMAAHPAPEAVWSAVLQGAGLPAAGVAAGPWWPLGLVERREGCWHIPSVVRRQRLADSARAEGRWVPGHARWAAAWRGVDGAREAVHVLETGRHEEAFPALLEHARRLLADGYRSRAGELTPVLREAVETRALGDDHQERLAVEVLELMIDEPSPEALQARLPRVDAHGERFDQAWLRTRYAYTLIGVDREEARRLLTEAVRVGGDLLPALRARHLLAVMAPAHEADAAYAAAQESLRAAGRDEDASFLQAIRAYRGGDVADAIQLLDRVLQGQPTDSLRVRAHTFLGAFAEQRHDFDAARRHYETAARVGTEDGRDAPPLLGLAEIALRDRQLWAVDAARRLRPRFEHGTPNHLLSVELICLVDDPVDPAAALAAMERTPIEVGYVDTLEVVRDARRHFGRDVDCLEPVFDALRRRLPR